MNLPNSITMSRIASVPLLIWFLSPHSQELAASGLFILASITDGLDGYLARRRGQITTMGMLLDPLADKLMVATAYIILVAYCPGIVPPWIAVLVIGREFLVSGLRSIAASEASPSTPARSANSRPSSRSSPWLPPSLPTVGTIGSGSHASMAAS